MPDQNKRKTYPKDQTSPPKQPGDKDPHHRPVRDTRDDPAPNPDGASGIPDEGVENTGPGKR